MAGGHPRRNSRRAEAVQEMEGIHGNEAHQCQLPPGLGLSHVLASTPGQAPALQTSSEDGNQRYSNGTTWTREAQDQDQDGHELLIA